MKLITQVVSEIEKHLFQIKITISDQYDVFGKWDFSPKEWEGVRQNAEAIPVNIGRSIIKGTEEEYFIYMYKGLFYLTEIDMEVEDVLLALKHLWQSKRDKLTRELDRIKAKAEFEGGHRTRIPEDVQILVWNRDGGKCVKCGRIENLEFDHIIPVSKGGSNTARNIQLLCEICNRSKGAKIGE